MLLSRVGRNAIAGSGASALSILLGLITTPVVLHSLGVSAYGALAVIGSLTAYIGIFDFGIGSSLGRFMTIHEERKDDRSLAGTMTFGFAFYAVMAAFMFPTLFFAAPTIGQFLSFPTDLQRDLPHLLVLLLGIFFTSSLSGIFGARLLAIHRLDISSYIVMVASIVSTILIFVFVPKYPHVETVFYCNFTQIALTGLGYAAAFAILTKRPPMLFGWLSLAQVRELLSFGVWSQLSGITAIVNLEADKVIISRYLGVANVTPYQVANRVALLSRIFPLQLIGAMLPELTAQVSRGLSTRDLEALYERASRSLMLATMFISGFVAGAADAVMRFWLGAHLPWAPELCAALVLSYIVNNATGVGTTIIKAQGRPQLETTYGVVSAVLNIGFTLLLIRGFGLFGVVAGTIIGNVLGSAFFLAMFHRQANLPWWNSMGHWLLKLFVMMGGAAALAFIVTSYVGHDEISRLRVLPGLIIAGLLYVLAFGAIGFVVRFWTSEETSMAGRACAEFLRGRAASP